MPARIPKTNCGNEGHQKTPSGSHGPHRSTDQQNSSGNVRAPDQTLKRQHSFATAFTQPELPRIAWVAAALIGGITIGSAVPPAPLLFLAAGPACLFAANVWGRRHRRHVCFVCVLTAIVLLGAARWQLHQTPSAQRSLNDICGDGPVTLTLTGHVTSVPCLHVRPSSENAPRIFGAATQSRFLMSAQSVITSSGQQNAGENLQVYVDGDATAALHKGDEVMLTGRWNSPRAPGNPGEFDYARFLHRRQISGLFFVNHPAAIRVMVSCGKWSAGYWVTKLRKEAHSVLVTALPERVRGIALALLLGNRNQLPSETANAFVASGTMHLLAISGLHVGILCTFLLSIFHLLIVRRSRALLLTATVCVIFAMITDLRPSVLRATVFFIVLVVAQFVRRSPEIVSLLSITAIIMISAQPHLVFDTGAWLSFLSVAALGWVSGPAISNLEQQDVPADALSAGEKLRDVFQSLWTRLKLRWRQMLAILALTTPLVAATFHVISPAGILVNVLLIPLTGLTLCVGFVLLAAGMLHPSLALLVGPGFSWLLSTMTRIVEATSSVHLSHVYVADVPDWFLVTYYTLVPFILSARWRPAKRMAVLCLYCSILAAFISATQPGATGELQCTVLDVGHGSAAVLEFPDGKVILVDGGAMNRGDRAADTICQFLWNRGHRSLNGILISHADADHYNAVAGILGRMPVSEIITSRDFVTSESASVQSLIRLAHAAGTPVRILSTGDAAQIGTSSLHCLQRDPRQLPGDADDNEKSIVFIAEHAGRRIVLPGDLEGTGSHNVFHEMGPVDVCISPHHGSPSANTDAFAEKLTPHNVIVSARSSAHADQLKTIYGNVALYHTSDSGAVSVSIASNGRLSITPFRSL